MKIFQKALAALAVAAIMFTGVSCNSNSTTSQDYIPVVTNPNMGSDRHETKLSEPVSIGDTVFTVNAAVDINHTNDLGKFIYVNYTVKNKSKKPINIVNIDSFYISYNGETKLSHVTTTQFALNNIEGYKASFSVEPSVEYTGYIGFLIPEDVKGFSFGYYVGDKTSVILCDINETDYTAPPEGMFK